MERKTSAIIVGVVAILLVTTAVSAVIVASDNKNIVTVTGYASGWKSTDNVYAFADALNEWGATNVNVTINNDSATITFTPKEYITMHDLDVMMYQATNENCELYTDSSLQSQYLMYDFYDSIYDGLVAYVGPYLP